MTLKRLGSRSVTAHNSAQDFDLIPVVLSLHIFSHGGQSHAELCSVTAMSTVSYMSQKNELLELKNLHNVVKVPTVCLCKITHRISGLD